MVSVSSPVIRYMEYVYTYVCMVITYSKSMDQPDNEVANPARGQLNRGNEYSPVPVRA